MRSLVCVPMLVAAWAAPALSVEPAEWGQRVNGLRMALALVDVGPKEPQVVEITIENTGDQTTVVQIGWFGETKAGLTLQAGSDAGSEWVDFMGEGGVASSGRCPFLVPLLAGSRYQIRRSTGTYVMSKLHVSLGKFLLGPGPRWLRANLRAGASSDPLLPTTTQDPRRQGCVDERLMWRGTLSSNTLRFEARR